MFLIFGYFIGCFAAAAILTLLGSMARPVKQQGESSSGRTLLTWWLLISLAPYAFNEGLTKWKGEEMERAVHRGIEVARLDGELQFFRVTRVGSTATVLAVVEERPLWDAATQRTVLRLHLVQEGGRWKFSRYAFVHAPSRNKDGISIPPYW